jgi:ParB family chromosome partitioning protein
MKVKYKEISKEMRRIATPDSSLTKENTQRSSVNTSIDVVEHYNVDLDRLIPYLKQARQTFDEDEIRGLAQSIKEHGVRQPLSIISSLHRPNFYEVVSGERRLRAAKMLGLKKIPCIILSDPFLAEEIALVENIQREDLSPIEMGEAFSKMLSDRPGLKQIELAEKLGVSHKLISECVRFSHLPSSVKRYLLENNVTARDLLRKILKSKNPETFVSELKEKKGQDISKKVYVLKVVLEKDVFSIHDSPISGLTHNQRREIKEILLNLCKKIIVD